MPTWIPQRPSCLMYQHLPLGDTWNTLHHPMGGAVETCPIPLQPLSCSFHPRLLISCPPWLHMACHYKVHNMVIQRNVWQSLFLSSLSAMAAMVCSLHHNILATLTFHMMHMFATPTLSTFPPSTRPTANLTLSQHVHGTPTTQT